jgi:hypothetical protein
MYKCIIYDTTRFKAVMVDGGSVHKPMKDASGDAGSKEGVIVTSHIAWE